MKDFLLIFVILLVSFCGKGQNTLTKLKETDEIFTSVEENPKFIGGEKAMYDFIYGNLKYPERAKEQGVKGKVFLKFVVEKDGSIGDVSVLKGIGAGCDEEAIFIIKNMPKWISGKQNGNPLRVYFTMPITFGDNSGIIKKGIIDNKMSKPDWYAPAYRKQ
jgi:TonB family protein